MSAQAEVGRRGMHRQRLGVALIMVILRSAHRQRLGLASIMLILPTAILAGAAVADSDPSSIESFDERGASWSVSSVVRSLDVDIGEDSTLTVRQVTAPLTLHVPVGASGDIVVTSGLASSTLDLVQKNDLAGVADVKMKGSVRFLDDHLLASLGIGLPTGKNAFTQEEANVAQSLAQTLFGFRTKIMGEGFDVDLGVAFARALSEASSIGIGAAYLRKGGYKVFEQDQEDYNPGDELTVTGGLDRIGEHVFLRADMSFRGFSTDKQGDLEIFQQGARIELDQQVIATWKRTSLGVRLRQALASDDGVLDASARLVDTEGPSDFWANVQFTRSFDLGAASGARMLARQISFDGLVSYGRFGASDFKFGDGFMAGIGGGVRIPVFSTATLRFAGEFLAGEGRLGRTGPKGDVRGYQIALEFGQRVNWALR